MRKAGSGRAVALSLLGLAALAAAASGGCVKTAAAGAASSEEEQPSSGGMYLVPHLGKHQVLGPVTGAPPGKLVHVPLSAPSVSVRRKDELVTQPRLPEKRSVLEAPPDEGSESYYEKLMNGLKEHPRRRRPRFGLGSPGQADVR